VALVGYLVDEIIVAISIKVMWSIYKSMPTLDACL
jgi:hypothetical protein